MWLLANMKNGTSSHELACALGVTQKTAWFMLHRIRLAMRETNPAPLKGVVEADETFVGGKKRATMTTGLGFKKMKGGPGEGKATVLRMVERGDVNRKSRVRAMVVPDHKAASILPPIYRNVLPGSVLYTDSLRSYRQAGHDYIHHSIENVNGNLHTNSIEKFWSCLKRTLHRTYIASRAFHLQAYVEEQVFPLNAREGTDATRFEAALKGADGKRVTYAELTGDHMLWRLIPSRSKNMRSRKS